MAGSGGYLALAAALAVLAAAVAHAEPGWTLDRNTGCRIWDDNPGPGWSVTWSGRCVDGMGHGHGVVQLYDRAGVAKSRYEGDL